MKILWTKNAASDLEFHKKNHPSHIKRIKSLINSIKEDPYVGIGKPEPLKHNLSGCWSRRITSEHRLVYKVKDHNEIVILQCNFHYR